MSFTVKLKVEDDFNCKTIVPQGLQIRFAIIVKIIIDQVLKYGHGMEIPWVIEQQTRVKHQLLKNYIVMKQGVILLSHCY